MSSSAATPAPPSPWPTAAGASDESATDRVVILPDARFFVRTLSVDPAATATQVAAEVELALETLSPFPVAQLYHGHYWQPGSSRVLVYAAYRRRFTAEETERWPSADLVIPAFVTAMGMAAAPATTLLLVAEDSCTALHWSEPGPVPTKVLIEPVVDSASEEERARVRDDVVKGLGGRRVVTAVTETPIPLGTDDERDFRFRLGEATTRLAGASAEALDVRDKEELAALRRARQRDRWMWRGFVGLLGVLLLCLLAEGAMVGIKAWQSRRQQTLVAQQPEVDRIMRAQSLSERIEKLTTERLRPFEMMDAASQPIFSGQTPSIQFVQVNATGLYVLEIKAKTTVASEVDAYQSALRRHPAIANVAMPDYQGRGGETNFTFVITFRPEILKGAKPTAQP